MNHVLTDEECCVGHTEGPCRRCRQCYRWIGAEEHDTTCEPSPPTPNGHATFVTVTYTAGGSSTLIVETVRL